MTRLEQIARDLAAALSAEGEAAWRRFLPLAREVGGRLDRQFADIMIPGAEGSHVPRPIGRGGFARRGKPTSGRM